MKTYCLGFNLKNNVRSIDFLRNFEFYVEEKDFLLLPGEHCSGYELYDVDYKFDITFEPFLSLHMDDKTYLKLIVSNIIHKFKSLRIEEMNYTNDILLIFKILIELLKIPNIISIECPVINLGDSYILGMDECVIYSIFNKTSLPKANSDFIANNRLPLKQIFSKCYLEMY